MIVLNTLFHVHPWKHHLTTPKRYAHLLNPFDQMIREQIWVSISTTRKIDTSPIITEKKKIHQIFHNKKQKYCAIIFFFANIFLAYFSPSTFSPKKMNLSSVHLKPSHVKPYLPSTPKWVSLQLLQPHIHTQ